MCIAVPLPGVTEGYVVLAVTLESWLGHKVSLLPSQIRGVFKRLKEEDAIVEVDPEIDAELIEELNINPNHLN